MEMKRFPENRIRYFEQMNKQDLYRMPYNGLFVASMKEFPEREYLVFIPEGAYLSTPAVLLVADERQDNGRFLTDSGWMDAAKEAGILLFLVGSDWNSQELAGMLEEIRARDCHVVNKNYVYLAGYGSGASRAQELAMRHPSAFAGLVLAGNCQISQEQLDAASRMPSEMPGVALSAVSMPVWLITDRMTGSQQSILDYWKKANRVQPEAFVQKGSTWYLPSETTQDSLIDELTGGKVRVTEQVVMTPYPGIAPLRIWKEFFSRYLRATGIGNWNLRLRRTEEEAGLEFRTQEVDGCRREWYQYIPSAMRQNPDYKAPLVISLHGGSNLHRMFLPTTEWPRVAEARGFMVVFPAAALRPFRESGWLSHAAWNASRNRDMLDDEKFLVQMLETLFKEYNIDRSRVYISGHSMGAVMGQRLLLARPQYFAAAGLTSGVLRGGFFGDYRTPGIVEDHQKPIWIIMGEKDIGGGTLETNSDVRRYVDYWSGRNRTCPPDRPLLHRTGAYETQVYVNEKGVPMVCVSTVANKPHSCTPQDSWFLYDAFFSKFSMDQEGRTVYLGRVVME